MIISSTATPPRVHFVPLVSTRLTKVRVAGRGDHCTIGLDGRRDAGMNCSRGKKSAFDGFPGYKPVSVPLQAIVIHLGRSLLDGSSDLPGSSKERAAPPPLFGLAPRGVYLAGRIAPPAVRSYRTISPLPTGWSRQAVYFLWHFP